MSYNEALKDPRWQKKRLEILERDEWTCKRCGNKDSTLHVHHKYYSKDTFNKPWSINSKALVTLCESCHKYVSDNKTGDEFIQLLYDIGAIGGDDFSEIIQVIKKECLTFNGFKYMILDCCYDADLYTEFGEKVRLLKEKNNV